MPIRHGITTTSRWSRDHESVGQHPVESVVVVEDLRRIGEEAGLAAVGVAAATPFLSTREHLEQRKAAGLHGGMGFTYRNPDRSTDPTRVLPDAQSLVVGAYGYLRAETSKQSENAGRVARYAWEDHYGALAVGLEAIAAELRRAGWRAVVVADQNHLVDREAAYRAGLGWYGKSSNLLLPNRGSWFVLGAVVTNASLPPAVPIADGCGPCRRCIDGCPTAAIIAPGVVDARRCLAWLVQAPGTFPLWARTALGDRIYGCDDCQEVCPPNRRQIPQNVPTANTAVAWVDLVDLLAASNEQLLDRHGRWYIAARNPRWLRRNALIALGNVGDANSPEVVASLQNYLTGDDEMLRSHAEWAAGSLGLVDLVKE